MAIYYPQILSKIETEKWAVLPATLETILKITEKNIDISDYPQFHGSSKNNRNAIVTDLGRRMPKTRNGYVKGNVGLLYIDGPIIPRTDSLAEMSGITSVQSLTKDFQAFEKDESIKEVLIVMDTPGGSVTGISEFSQYLKSSQKPVDVFVYGFGASAGYWIASSARKIYTSDTAEVGSIGVVATYRDTTKQDEQRGVKNIEIVSNVSPYKRPDINSDDGRASIQKNIDALADIFVDTVAKNRKTTREKVLSDFGKGGMLVASEALKVGMIDGITTLDALLKKKNKANEPKNSNNSVYSITGNSNNQKGSASMPQLYDENGDPVALTADMVKADHPSVAQALQEEGASTAIQAEHKRIQGIEALASTVSNMGADAVATANKVIAENKFNTDKNADNMGMTILSAVNSVYKDKTAGMETDARNIASIAAVIPGASDDSRSATGGDEDEQKALANDIASAM